MDSATQTALPADQISSRGSSDKLLRSIHQMPANTKGGSKAGKMSVSDQSQLIDFLAHPQSYGVQSHVDQLDIGDATLFVVGDHCYKFLHHDDERAGQGHRQERLRLMREEMQLGRLFAPEVYVGLVPIAICDGYLKLLFPECRGLKQNSQRKIKIVDWLICMNRYDLTDSYDKRIEHHQPNHAECSHLASLVRTGREKASPAEAHNWLAWLDDQLDSLDEFVHTLQNSKDRCQSHACLTRAKDRLSQVSGLIEERGERGCMRPIHGNLNLSNVVCLPSGLCSVNPDAGRVTRGVGDPVFDLAFLISELWSRNLSRQANWLLSHYCNQLLDSRAMDGLAALDLYLCCAALERAKALTTHRSATAMSMSAPVEKCGNRLATDRYLQTARQCLLQDQAYLVVLGGGHGAERSQLARLLAPTLGRMPGAVHLSSEREMLALHDVDKASDLPAPSHRHSVWNHVYRRLCAKAKLALEAGYSVILDGNFSHETGRVNLEQLLSHCNRERQVHSHAFWLYRSGRAQRDLTSNDQDLEMLALDNNKASDGTEPYCGGIPRGLEDWTSINSVQPANRLLDQMLAAVMPFWEPVKTGSVH